MGEKGSFASSPLSLEGVCMPDLDAIAKIVANYGPLLVLFGLFVWALKVYVPRFIESHIKLMDSTESAINELTKSHKTLADNTVRLTENTEQLTRNTEKLASSMIFQQSEMNHCRSTSQALLGLCEAFHSAAKGHPEETKIVYCLENVKTVLRTSHAKSSKGEL